MDLSSLRLTAILPFCKLCEVVQTSLTVSDVAQITPLERKIHVSWPGRKVTCKADYGANGSLTVQDIFSFQNAWFAGTLAGDFNSDGVVTVQDLFAFLNAWFAAC